MGAKVGGGGGKKYDLGQNADINVTPFVDVMLVLLIIFMVAAPLATVSIKVDLPPAVDRPDDVKPKEPVYISILKDGRLNLSGKQDTNLGNLVPDLTRQLAAFDPAKPVKDQSVLIRADAEVLYDDFMQVVNTLQQNGFYKVGLISEEI